MTTLATDRNVFVDLAEVDRLLMAKQYQKAFNAFCIMLEMLGSYYARYDQTHAYHYGVILDENADVCQRAAAQWQELLQSSLTLSKQDLGSVMCNMHVLHTILMGTRQGNLDNYIVAFHLKCQGRYDVEGLLHQLLAWCPNSRAGINPFLYYNHAPDLVLSHAVGCLVDLALVSEEANKARQSAIDFLLGTTINYGHLSRHKGVNLLSLAWMRCSYADDARRHQVKPLLTKALDKLLGLPSSFYVPEKKARHNLDKPVLLVPLEGMSREHAMYRCYAEMIRACRIHFYTLGVGVDDNCDDAVAALFDEFDVVENSANIKSLPSAFQALQKRIIDLVPDVVWFPSIGMDRWAVMLANRRMASLQVMSMGHPATSMSKQIDAILEVHELQGDPSRYSEKYVVLPDKTARYLLPSQQESVQPLRNLPIDGVIRVAVPSVSQKWTSRFIACMREVQARASKPVEFVFFSGVRGVDHAASCMNLSRELRNFKIHSVLPYADYIREINRCQIHACTFPFGGTNSLVDSLRQGLPLVAMEGDEVHERIDAMFIRKVGLPDWLIARNDEQYINALLRLIDQPEDWNKWHRYLLDEVDVDEIFLEEGNPDQFADLLYQLHKTGKEALSK